MYFPLRTAFPVPIGFGQMCFHFCWSPKIVWVSSKFFLVIEFQFQIIVVWEYAGNNLSLLVSVETCFVTQNMIYSWECSMGIRIEWLFLGSGVSVLYISIRSNSSSMAFEAFNSLLSFCQGVLSISDSGVLRSPTPYYYCVFIYMSLYFGKELACASCCSPVGAYIFIIVIVSFGYILKEYYSALKCL